MILPSMEGMKAGRKASLKFSINLRKVLTIVKSFSLKKMRWNLLIPNMYVFSINLQIFRDLPMNISISLSCLPVISPGFDSNVETFED